MSAREQRSLHDPRSSEYDDRYDDEYDDFDADGPERRKKRRMVPLVAGVIAIPVGLTLAGALVLNTVSEDGQEAANGTSAVGEIGEGAVADDSLVPEGGEDDDFFDEPTGSPERTEPSGDSAPRSAQATATYSPEDSEEADSEGGGSGGGGGGGNGGGGGGGNTTNNAGSATANEVVDLVNDERSSNGCDPVHVDGQLTAAAQEHSDDMAARDYMAHESPEGEGPGDRANRHGYNAWGAENVAKGQQSAQQVMDAWMNSEGHRANILNCDLQAIGVGEADSAWTQKFGYQ